MGSYMTEDVETILIVIGCLIDREREVSQEKLDCLARPVHRAREVPPALLDRTDHQ